MIEDRKKVVFLITKSTLGGAQRYVYDLALALDPERFDPIIIAGGDGPLIDMLRVKCLQEGPRARSHCR